MSEVREMTVKEMLGLLEWHEQMGRGDYVVKADPRTLAGLNALEPVLIAQGIVSEGWAAGVVA